MVTVDVLQLWNSLTDPTFRFLIMIFIFHMITMTATSSCSSPSIWSWLKNVWNILLSSSRHHHYQPYQQYQNTWILFSGWDSLFWGTGWLREGLSQRPGLQCWYFTLYHHDPLMIYWWYDEDMEDVIDGIWIDGIQEENYSCKTFLISDFTGACAQVHWLDSGHHWNRLWRSFWLIRQNLSQQWFWGRRLWYLCWARHSHSLLIFTV